MSRKRPEPASSTTPTRRMAAVRPPASDVAPALDRETLPEGERETLPASPTDAPSSPPVVAKSAVRPKRRASVPVAATIDEVVADLSKDPRHED